LSKSNTEAWLHNPRLSVRHTSSYTACPDKPLSTYKYTPCCGQLPCLQAIASFLSSLGFFGQNAADGMTTSEGAENRASSGSAFADDGSALNEDISFLLRMANESGAAQQVACNVFTCGCCNRHQHHLRNYGLPFHVPYAFEL